MKDLAEVMNNFRGCCASARPNPMQCVLIWCHTRLRMILIFDDSHLLRGNFLLRPSSTVMYLQEAML